jgi:ankyrin repeat protein
MKSKLHWLLLVLTGWLLATACGPSAPAKSLHAAVQEGDYPTVRHHIAAKSDLNAKDRAGWTPLHLAAMKGDLPMVQLLATAGADVTKAGTGGKTPMDVAQEKGKTNVAQFLESKLPGAPEQATTERRGRGLMDGGLGVSEVLDAN